MNFLKLEIPMIPPGVNHYVRHTRRGLHYVTPEAKAFKDYVAILLRNKFLSPFVVGKTFGIEAWIYLGPKERGDVDGFGKLILDALAEAGAFRNKIGEWMSDAHVTDLRIHKRRGPESKTVIEVTPL